jgi:hypothetical protein
VRGLIPVLFFGLVCGFGFTGALRGVVRLVEPI